jgi:hypothetical protein
MNFAEARRLDTAEKRWPHTFYAVDGDSFDAWKEWHERATSWEQCHGWLITLGRVAIMKLPLGKVERMSVCVAVDWVLINGKLVAFYDATSQVVDHRIVDKYIRGNCSRHTNVLNFHLAMHDIERAAQAPGPDAGDASKESE